MGQRHAPDDLCTGIAEGLCTGGHGRPSSEHIIDQKHTHAPGHLFRTSESACNIVQSFLGREPHLRPGRTPAMQDVGTQVKASVCAKAAAKQLCLVVAAPAQLGAMERDGDHDVHSARLRPPGVREQGGQWIARTRTPPYFSPCTASRRG